MSQVENVLRLEHVTMQFGGVVAVNDLSLEVNQGEIVALIGPNGAGKTTAFNCITGVYEPTNGRISFLGEPMVENHPQGRMQKLYQGENQGMFSQVLSPTPDRITQKGIARTFQNIRLFNDLTVEENVTVAMDAQMKYNMVSGIFRLPSFWKEEKVAHERALELLSLFHMEDLANVKAGSLPYGAQRRLEIVRALATNPSVILLDEPAAGLDPEGRDEILSEVKEYHKKTGTTVLLVSHSMEDIAKYADRVLVMSNKKIAMYDTVENVFARAPELLALGLSVPQVTKIFLKLREMGVDVPADVYTVPYAVKMILEAKKRRDAGESLVLPRVDAKKGGAATC